MDASGPVVNDPEGLHFPRPTPEEAEAMERTAPGALPWDEYFRFLKQFPPTREQLEKIPLNFGPRFTLED